MYLVVLVSERVAPKASGRCTRAVAKVLSTTTGMSRDWATAQTCSRSITLSRGLVGLSSHTMAGWLLRMASSACGWVKSTHAVRSPNLANTCSNSRTVQP